MKTMSEAYHGIYSYMDYYTETRLHQSLKYCTPAEVYYTKVI